MTVIARIVVLRKRSEFLAVAAENRKWVAPGLIVQARLILQKGTPASSENPIIRYGLTASSKVGNAVTRNRARRRLRALAHAVLPQHAVPGHDYVLIARSTTPARDYKALEQDLLNGLKKLGAYRDPVA